jgi:membrane protein required for colicin V production
MNWLDFIIAVPLSLAIFKGFQKGFIVSVFSLIAIFVGIYMAVHFSDAIAPKLKTIFEVTDKWLPLFAFASLLIGVYLGVILIAKAVEKLVDLAALGFVNKLGGAVFNFIKTTLIIGAILSGVNALSQKNALLSDKIKNESIFYKPIYTVSQFLIPALKSSKLFQPVFDLKEDIN